MTDRYAVIGNPIEHSKSPGIHSRFAALTGEDIAYERILAPTPEFASIVAKFRAGGGKGANITLPFKGQASTLVDELSARAQAAGAVNTMIFESDRIRGDNTDGCGLVRDLRSNLRFIVSTRRVLLLGAGGAARGVLQPLLDEHPASITIANRTEDKARRLVAALPPHCRGSVDARGYAELGGQSFDLVINATSAGLTDTPLALPNRLYSVDSLAYDMVYGKDTAFLKQARADGAARTSDGLGMLVEQAAESFFLWRGVRPPTAPVLLELRSA